VLSTPQVEREALRTARRGVVYFIRAEVMGLIKIGCAVNMHRRLSMLQSGCPDRLAIVAYVGSDDIVALERAMHRRFDAHREHHEWFRPGPDLLAYIEDYAYRPAKPKRPKRAEEIIRAVAIARRAVENLHPAPSPAPVEAAEVLGPSGNSRKARMERYRLARGLAR
jgi:hypothetical protein